MKWGLIYSAKKPIGVLFSIGCAGVPGGGLAIATILIQAFNLPTQIVAWIAAIFAYLDVTGNDFFYALPPDACKIFC